MRVNATACAPPTARLQLGADCDRKRHADGYLMIVRDRERRRRACRDRDFGDVGPRCCRRLEGLREARMAAWSVASTSESLDTRQSSSEQSAVNHVSRFRLPGIPWPSSSVQIPCTLAISCARCTASTLPMSLFISCVVYAFKIWSIRRCNLDAFFSISSSSSFLEGPLL